jgi:DNA-binding NtrC family response regulator
MRILCVDDDGSSRVMLRGLLERMCDDCEVLLAPSAEAALAVLELGAVDLLITDMVMPGMDGIALLEKVKQARPETEVVVVTGHSSIETAVEAMRLGARDYLPKPINPGLLEEKLVTWRELIESRRESDDFQLALAAIGEDVQRTALERERTIGELSAILEQLDEAVCLPGVDAETVVETIRALLECWKESEKQ